MRIASAFVEMRVDKSKLGHDLDGVEQDVKKKADSTAKVFAQVFGAAAFGAGIKKSIDAASSLNETVSKTKIVFGDAADGVIAFSKTAAVAMGMSERAYLDAAAGLKGLLDNLGLAGAESTKWSQDLTKLAGDMASFSDKTPEEAIAALGSALRGESEPIRAFNVNLNEAAIKAKALELGMYSGKGAIDDNAKAQVTLALIMEQTVVMQGDFERTAGSAANAQRTLTGETENSAASLGSAFLPIYTKVVQIVTALAKGFGELPAPVQVAVVALAGLVALSGPIHSMIDMAKGLTAAIKGMGPAGAAAAGALGLVVLALFAYDQGVRNAKRRNDEFNTSLSELSRGADVGKALWTSLAAGYAQVALDGKSMTEVFDGIAKGNIEGAKRALEWAEANGQNQTVIDGLREAVEKEDAAVAQSIKTTEDATVAVEDKTAADGSALAALDRVKHAQETFKTATEEATKAILDQIEAELAAIGNTGDLEQQVRDVASGYYDLQQQIVANDKTQADHKISDDEKLQSTRDLASAIHTHAEEVLALSAKYATETGAAATSKEAHDRQLAILVLNKAQYPELATEIQKYIDALNLIPTDINTVATFSTAGKIKPPKGGGLAYLDDGGLFDKATSAVIGEAGREAVLPLTKPSRLAALLADPAIGGPISAAMPSGPSAGPVAGSTGPLFTVGAINGSEAMRRHVEASLNELAAEIMAGRL